MPHLNATVTLPLLMESHSERVKRGIRSLHEDLAFSFEMDIGAVRPIVTLKPPEDKPEAEVDRIALLFLRQKIESELAELIQSQKPPSPQ